MEEPITKGPNRRVLRPDSKDPIAIPSERTTAYIYILPAVCIVTTIVLRLLQLKQMSTYRQDPLAPSRNKESDICARTCDPAR